jgi:murein DD-endopeptidase MepM/ murein hydrolase activator NlpD
MIQKYITGIFISLMAVVCFLLVSEYCSLKQETEKIISLRNDYLEYLSIVKNFLKEQKRGQCFVSSCESDDLDKNQDVASVFPEGVKIYSSDVEESDDESVITTNELDYKQDTYFDYLKRNLEQQKTKKIAVSQNVSKTIPKQKQWVHPSVSRFKGLLKKSQLRKKDINFIWPIKRSLFWISSFYGPRRKANGARGFHYGIDMAAIKGIAVKAVAPGVVTQALFASGYGKTVVISHNKKYKTRYAHLSTINVRVGQRVEQGKVIGRVGATGLVRKSGKEASHLHFEVYENSRHINPLYLLL